MHDERIVLIRPSTSHITSFEQVLAWCASGHVFVRDLLSHSYVAGTLPRKRHLQGERRFPQILFAGVGVLLSVCMF